MTSFNVSTGLPRAGSTLLQNVLNQNPNIYASSTSPLIDYLLAMSNISSNNPAVKSQLINDYDGTYARIHSAMGAFIKSWYPQNSTILDKSRMWASSYVLLNSINPDAKIICIVRDPRAVYASIIKQDGITGLLSDGPPNLQHRTIHGKADSAFTSEGLVGMPIVGVEDLIRRRDNIKILFIKFEDLCINPEATLLQVHGHLGLPHYKYDFENIESVADDCDALYLNKFPHSTRTKIQAQDTDAWQKYVDTNTAEMILKRYPLYSGHFGYK